MHYEPFGERVEDETGDGQPRASRTLSRVGVGLFWTSLVVIVAARAMYFQPWNFDGLRIAALAKDLLGIF